MVALRRNYSCEAIPVLTDRMAEQKEEGKLHPLFIQQDAFPTRYMAIAGHEAFDLSEHLLLLNA